jgi:hypothetical protein
MTPCELFEVIVNFQEAVDRKKIPDFNKNRHRVEQVLRILMVDWHNFHENEEKRACDDQTRQLWENFWDYPKVQEVLKHPEYTRSNRGRWKAIR